MLKIDKPRKFPAIDFFTYANLDILKTSVKYFALFYENNSEISKYFLIYCLKMLQLIFVIFPCRGRSDFSLSNLFLAMVPILQKVFH